MAEVAVRERPIVFSGEMVRAILDGRNTQTRLRVMPRTSTVLGYPSSQFWSHLLWDRGVYRDPGPDPFGYAGYEYLHVAAWNPADGPVPANDNELCRYRVRPLWGIGERLWVRERWCITCAPSGPLNYPCVEYFEPRERRAMRKWEGHFVFPDGSFGAWPEEIVKAFGKGNGWRSPVHMPRWASRITLEISGIRVEQVQDKPWEWVIELMRV